MKRLFNFKLILPLLALLVVVGVAPKAQADALLPGTLVQIAPLPTASAAGFMAGAVVLGNTGNVAVVTGSFSGTARSAVVRNAGGTLDFYYQFSTTTAQAGGEPHRLTGFSFLGFSTDVFQIVDATAVAGNFTVGTQAALLVDRPGLGSVVGWNYLDATGIPAGVTNYTFLIRTNATEFQPGTYSIINGGATQITAFAPATVPEPASMLLLGTGLVGTVGVVRRRLKARKSS